MTKAGEKCFNKIGHENYLRKSRSLSMRIAQTSSIFSGSPYFANPQKHLVLA